MSGFVMNDTLKGRNKKDENPMSEILFRLNAIWNLKEHFEKAYNQVDSENKTLQKTIDENSMTLEVKSHEIEELKRMLRDKEMELDRERRNFEIMRDQYRLERDKLMVENNDLRNWVGMGNESWVSRSEYESLKKRCNQRESHIVKLQRVIREKYTIFKDREEAQKDGTRELVEQLIVYAEGEDKNVAREIKIALNTKMANGFIASDVLTDEWKQRLEDLGRDKPRRSNAMNFNNQVGTVVAHADHVTLQYRENE